MKILVLGASGLLGATLVPHLLTYGHQVMAHSRSGGNGCLAADLTSPYETSGMVGKAKPDTIINLAGLTDVDRCETDPTQAWLSNVRAVENIAVASCTVGAHLVHVSTDHLYNLSPASTENDALPGNQYAMTKYAGELAALAVPATVLRTNFFGASRHTTRRSLTDWLFTALTGASPVQVFEDVRFSPLSMATLCEMMEQVAQTRPVGIFNLGSNAGMSKADFAFSFAAELQLPNKLLTRSTTQQAAFLKTWRPKEMCMDNTKFETAFNLILPNLDEEIGRAAKDYRELN